MKWLILMLCLLLSACARPSEPQPSAVQTQESSVRQGKTVSQTTNLELVLQEGDTLDQLTGYPALKTLLLDCQAIESMPDLSAAAELPQLESLILVGWRGSLTQLQTFEVLPELHLYCCEIGSLDNLPVEQLYLSECGGTVRTSTQSLTRLELVYLSGQLPEGAASLVEPETVTQLILDVEPEEIPQEDLVQLPQPLILTDPSELPSWLPFPAEDAAAFLTREGNSIMIWAKG